MNLKYVGLSSLFMLGISTNIFAQKPEDTEVYSPVPAKVTPGKTIGSAPSDAIQLFNGTDLSQWEDVNKPGQPANWIVSKGILTVNKQEGNIQTKEKFGNYQLHLEWKIPKDIDGTGQARGNSGVFLASTGDGDNGYELQILDSYDNKTYTNGQAGSIYKQAIPIVNPALPVGEWQFYDIIWHAPTFNTDGTVDKKANVTVLFNGVLVQDHYELTGETRYIGKPYYKSHGKSAIKLQAHGDKSKPLSYRNIWVRNIP
ncbi:3-keto-disaccharide hydrolase [Rhizosphaericola mali]|uniref:DUF1080 domain-containing protein n=1 Tax=Rhizosphaericola mali TaxID=2545455 RepID=A0A5P2FWA2_9BACT|nr:DUF1080 domain-containing protein [Rhizosphaericola mali]QES87804.1 DUF1080 domain-containing protein [Rhizosphaericola mali]